MLRGLRLEQLTQGVDQVSRSCRGCASGCGLPAAPPGRRHELSDQGAGCVALSGRRGEDGDHQRNGSKYPSPSMTDQFDVPGVGESGFQQQDRPAARARPLPTWRQQTVPLEESLQGRTGRATPIVLDGSDCWRWLGPPR